MDHRSYTMDSYSKIAKAQGYRSRASLKLLEIDQKHKIFKPTQKVLDLGCAPGGWSQVAYEKVGDKGLVVGIDILPTQPYKNVQFIQADFQQTILQTEFDVVLSDVCANKTGNCFIDDLTMFEFGKQLLNKAQSSLSAKGWFVCKFFYSIYEKEFNTLLCTKFKSVKKYKPNASRSCSSEFYYIGQCLI